MNFGGHDETSPFLEFEVLLSFVNDWLAVSPNKFRDRVFCDPLAFTPNSVLSCGTVALLNLAPVVSTWNTWLKHFPCTASAKACQKQHVLKFSLQPAFCQAPLNAKLKQCMYGELLKESYMNNSFLNSSASMILASSCATTNVIGEADVRADAAFLW